jgi:putative methyltransferase (TIGR04325 family)
MKQLLKEFARLLIPSRSQGLVSANYSQIFLSYQDALKLCTRNAYEDQELIEIILKKTKRFCENLKSNILPNRESTVYSLESVLDPVIKNKSKSLNVLDFGGACGAHYFQMRCFIDTTIKLNWVVVETPTMVKYAKELESEELSFFDNFQDAISKLGTIDLIHTSGTLQCVDDPYKYLDEILRCNANWILFNRLGLSKHNKDVITIHKSKLSWNGVGELPEGYTDRWIKYPFNFCSENKIIGKINEKYSIVKKFSDGNDIYPVNGEEIIGYGILCKNKAVA